MSESSSLIEPAESVRTTSRRKIVIAIIAAAAVVLGLAGGGVAFAIMGASGDEPAVADESPAPAAEHTPPTEEPVIVVTAPEARIDCASITPTSAVATPFSPDPWTVELAHSLDAVAGAPDVASRQAGLASCSWISSNGAFTAWGAILPDGANAYAAWSSATPALAGTVFDTVVPGSRVACTMNACDIDLPVEASWFEAHLDFGAIGLPSGFTTLEQANVAFAESFAVAFVERIGAATIGPAWNPEPRAFDVSALCEPGVGAAVWGVEAGPGEPLQGGGAVGDTAVVEGGLVGCSFGLAATVSAVTSGAWAWSVDLSNEGDTVQVAGADAARVTCGTTCFGDVSYRGSYLQIATADTSDAGWVAAVEALLSEAGD